MNVVTRQETGRGRFLYELKIIRVFVPNLTHYYNNYCSPMHVQQQRFGWNKITCKSAPKSIEYIPKGMP